MLNIPSSLLIAAVLVVLAYVVANPLLRAVEVPFAPINLPLGLAAMFLGVFTVAVRREAVPQLLGLLALENGVLFAGVAIVPSLPLIPNPPPLSMFRWSPWSLACLPAASTHGSGRQRLDGCRLCGSIEAVMELALVLIIPALASGLSVSRLGRPFRRVDPRSARVPSSSPWRVRCRALPPAWGASMHSANG